MTLPLGDPHRYAEWTVNLASLPESTVAENIARFLAQVPTSRRGQVLRRVFEMLEPESAKQLEPEFGVCSCCGARYTPKSINQRYCTFRCAKEAEHHKRMARSVSRAISNFSAPDSQFAISVNTSGHAQGSGTSTPA